MLEFSTVIFTPTSGRLFSSLTVPEIVFVCEKAKIGKRINTINKFFMISLFLILNLMTKYNTLGYFRKGIYK